MGNLIKNICVFASASNNIDEKYFITARKLGQELAQNGYDIVYGGSNLGLMGEVSSYANKFGSKVTGIMPEKLYNLGINPGSCHNFVVTKGMRERKAKMDELSDGIVVLSGGFGTLEEVSEMLVQKQLGYNNKPIVFLNTDNFYEKLISFFDKLIEENFAPKETTSMYFVANTVKEAVDYLKNYKNEKVDYLDKKLHLKNQSNV